MPTDSSTLTYPAQPYVEQVEITGHIIDSLILPKVLDLITAHGGAFRILRITIGQARSDPSFALVEVQAPSEERLHDILAQIIDHGAVPTAKRDCRLEPADLDGAFPEGFYSTTNQRTEVRLNGAWVPVANQEMDCGIVVDPARRSARCVPMVEVRCGDSLVIGHAGVRSFPHGRARETHGFEFMSSPVSTEKPKGVMIRQIAAAMFENRAAGGRTLLVGGPAIVHTGSGEHVCRLIRGGYINVLFAGNALATHDIEQAWFGTSLGVQLERAEPVDAGHEHHLRAINRVRRLGGIARAVESGELTGGIMHECVRQHVEFVLAGSIRDDGPLPEVITDALEAQRRMRQQLDGVTFCLMVATTLHSIAVGNLLPDWVKVVCVDINPSTVIKLGDRGSFQTLGLVTDVEPFMRSLVEEISRLEHGHVTALD
ncbi:MAG: TIGR00300 family protein [Pirellulales bacterium]|nr:TIGR00300 family protein [Pirellulales bacterium]